jgi:hypothetical protein
MAQEKRAVRLSVRLAQTFLSKVCAKLAFVRLFVVLRNELTDSGD